MPRPGFKSMTVRVDILTKLKEEAKRNNRTVPEQIEYYINTSDKEASS